MRWELHPIDRPCFTQRTNLPVGHADETELIIVLSSAIGTNIEIIEKECSQRGIARPMSRARRRRRLQHIRIDLLFIDEFAIAIYAPFRVTRFDYW